MMTRFAKVSASLLLALPAAIGAADLRKSSSLRRQTRADGTNHEGVLEHESGRSLGKPEWKSYIVTFAEDDGEEDRAAKAQGLAKAHGGSTTRVYGKVLNGAVMQLTPKMKDIMLKKKEIAAIEDDIEVEATANSWGLDRIDQCGTTLDGVSFTKLVATDVKVYVIDTGIDYLHADFDGMIDPTSSCHKSEVWNNPIRSLEPKNSHGTHVASTICGKVYGVANCGELCSVQVLGTSGSGKSSAVIAGLDHAVADCQPNEKCVANMSLKGDFSEAENAAVANAMASGLVVVVAAGNSENDACVYSPASAPEAITVGATDQNDDLADFTNYGDCVDIYAPGVDILAADYSTDAEAETKSGTSMSAPHVAGLAAAHLHNGVLPVDVRDALRADATYMNVDCAHPGTGIATIGGGLECSVTNPNCSGPPPSTTTTATTTATTTTATTTTTTTSSSIVPPGPGTCAATGDSCRNNCERYTGCNNAEDADCCCCPGLSCKGGGQLKTCS